MQKYKRDFIINDGNVDFNMFCKMSDLFNFIQITTVEHLFSTSGYADMFKNKSEYTLILTNIWGKLYRPIKYGETLSIITYQRPLKSALIYRDFDFYIDGIQVGEAVTSLLVFNLNTRKIIKTTFFTEQLDEISYKGECKNVKFTTDTYRGWNYIDNYIVRYSDADKNGHMNNVRYAEIICDCVDLHLYVKAYVSEMKISFLSECRVGTQFKIFSGEKQNKYLFKGVDEHKTNKFEAYIKIKNIE